MYICEYLCVYMCIYVYVHLYTSLYLHTFVNKYIFIVCTYILLYFMFIVYLYAYVVYVCIYMCMFMFIFMHTHVFIVCVYMCIFTCVCYMVSATTMASRVTVCRRGGSRIKVKQRWEVEHCGVEKLKQGDVGKGEIRGSTWRRKLWKSMWKFTPVIQLKHNRRG